MNRLSGGATHRLRLLPTHNRRSLGTLLDHHARPYRSRKLSPGCRTCRTCRTLSDTVGPLSDADCRTGCRTVGHCQTAEGAVTRSLTVGRCRTPVGRCRTLSDAVRRCRTCRTVRLSDYCRYIVGHYCGVTYTRGVRTAPFNVVL